MTLNNHFIYFGLFFTASLCIFFISLKGNGFLNKEKIKGLTMVAPPKKFTTNPMISIKEVNAEWVAIVPYAYTPDIKAEVHYSGVSWQWWGETLEGVKASVQLAKENGLKVMLKPQVYIHGSWTGDMKFNSEEEWQKWEEEYEQYIMQMLEVAKEFKVELFCIGTEFNYSTELRIGFWTQLIEKTRRHYDGLLTYSDNWDHFEKIEFWDQLDYIGISAYFPLCDEINPSNNSLRQAWKPILSSLDSFSQKLNKKILFTEFGYLSVDGAAGKTWALEKNIEQRNINHKAQADAYNALFEALWNTSFWVGGFLWKWFPEDSGHEGYPERDYTPQHKEAEAILRNWYARK